MGPSESGREAEHGVFVNVADLQFFTQPLITAGLGMVVCPTWAVSQEGNRGQGGLLNS